MVSMLQDTRALYAEVLAFRARLKEIPDVTIQNISLVSRRLEKELQNLENDEQATHSTNTPDLIRMWRLARSLPALHAFSTTFQSFSRRKADAVTIDLVYRKGHAWMVRSSVKYRALITELANVPIRPPSPPQLQQPTLMHESSSMSLAESEDDGDLFSDGNLRHARVVEQAQKILEVAGNNLRLGAVPQITLYFPRIMEECRCAEDEGNVRRLFAFLERMGVECMVDHGPALSFEHNVGLAVKDDFGNSDYDLQPGEPLNLDLTTLFVLCSDISNVPLSALTETHKALAFQIQEESTVACLKDRLFPLLRGSRPLYCSPVAQRRFFEIISELGSPYEKQRAEALFAAQDAHVTNAFLSSISIHSWPDDILLPIQVRQFDMMTHSPTVPFSIDYKTAISQECFENGWYGRLLTLSANQQAVKVYREALFSWPDDLQPRPRVYLHAARSLTKYHRTTGHQSTEDSGMEGVQHSDGMI